MLLGDLNKVKIIFLNNEFRILLESWKFVVRF